MSRRVLPLLVTAALVPLGWTAGCLQDPDGPPTLELGTGLDAFEPVTPGETLVVVNGPQGGQHVWISVRVENMEPVDFDVEISLYDDASGLQIGYAAYTGLDLAREGGGWWTYTGLAFVITDLATVTAGPVRVELSCTDRDGRAAGSSTVVVIAG